MTTTTTTSSSEILHHTTTFISETLSQTDLRHRLYPILRRKIPSTPDQSTTMKALHLATETLENAIVSTTTNLSSSLQSPSSASSSILLAQKLLLSLPETPLSSFLLSLIYSLSHQPINAAASLLDIFLLEPSLARSEIAPVLFEQLFLVHLLPVLQSLNEQRTTVLSSPSTNMVVYDNNIVDESSFDVSVVLPSTKLLSKMNGSQALELKELEKRYEQVLDENCRLYVNYFKQVLRYNNGGDHRVINPPQAVLKTDKMETSTKDDTIKTENIGLTYGRYNPIWAEGDRSVEFYSSITTTSNSSSSSSKSKSSSSSPYNYPQRVPVKILKKLHSGRSTASTNLNSDSELESSLDENSADSSLSSESEPDHMEDNNRKMASFEPRQSQYQKQKQSISGESSRSSPDYTMADFENPPGSGKHTPPKTPPKDFVCPITTHLLDDPVTLETGQTYERKAIQEWLDRGNSTCPITRQTLHSTQLPKTNYVLKRLIASWQEQDPGAVPSQPESPQLETEPMIMATIPVTSPNSVISQVTVDGTMSELRHAITNLCMSEILKESEMAVLQIERFWQDMNADFDIENMLTKPPVINGIVEVLFNSVDPQVLNAAVFLLSELGSRDKSVIQTLTRVDSDVDCIVALFKKGLLEAVVLIYLLKPSTFSLIEMDLLDTLLPMMKMKDDEFLKMCLKPKTASVRLLARILEQSEESIVSSTVQTMISSKVTDNIAASLRAEMAEERIAAVGILLRCINEDGNCRNTIVEKAELAPVLESLTKANDGERFEIVQFLSELVKLNRRTWNEQVLHTIKDEGAFSTMHTLLVYLQTALQDQCPVVAGLLLQLDLLAEPRKMSIYREEAIDTLISCLRNSEFPASQIAAAETIVSLQGRFTASGKPLTRAFLLKRAGLEKSYKSPMRMEQLNNVSGEYEDTVEEEKEANDWERKMAFVLVSHEFGALFEALAEGLKSRYAELCSACFVAATWLINMLSVLPDTGIRNAARVCLLKRFVSIFKSAKDVEDKILCLLVLNTFINDPDVLHDLSSSMKDIMKGLKELRRYSPLAFEMLTVLSEGSEWSADFWNHKELVQIDSSENGEVLSIVCFQDKIFSGHSDGTITVWTGKGSILHRVEEIRKHTKAVTSLAILQSGEKLYSGSLDKTVRVWSIGSEGIHCVQVHDMKDQIHHLVVSNSIACFVPQGSGVKVHSWSGPSKLMNQHKYVRCMELVQGKLYCGCHDNSIQEIDLATGTLSTIQGSYRRLIGKGNPIHALQVVNGLIYSVSCAVDGSMVKIWSAPKYSIVGTLQTNIEVRAIAISSAFIYLGSKTGVVEVWDRKKHNKIETLQTGGSSRILSMALDCNEEVLVIGTSDGRIQAWGLS